MKKIHVAAVGFMFLATSALAQYGSGYRPGSSVPRSGRQPPTSRSRIPNSTLPPTNRGPTFPTRSNSRSSVPSSVPRMVYYKKCTRCNKKVADNATAGQRCPHYAIFWSRDMTNGKRASRFGFPSSGRYGSSYNAGMAVGVLVIGLIVVAGVVGLCVSLGRRRQRNLQAQQQQQTYGAAGYGSAPYTATFADQGPQTADYYGQSNFGNANHGQGGFGTSQTNQLDAGPIPFDSLPEQDLKPKPNDGNLQSPYDF